MISVLLSVYEKENPIFFSEALDSIYTNQTRKPDEVVLVEDGPLTKELYDAIDAFEKRCPCLVVHRFEKNQQLGRALAKGVEICSGDLIARMDTDDVALENRLEEQEAYMLAHPEVDVCGGWIEEFDTNDETFRQIKKMPEHHEDIYQYAKYRNPVNHMTVMLRKDAVLAVGNYEHFPLLEDYKLWMKLLAHGSKFYNVPKVLVRMRSGNNVYSRRGGLEYTKRYMGLRKYQKSLGLLHGFEYPKVIVLTLGMTASGSFLRKIFYRKVLRK